MCLTGIADHTQPGMAKLSLHGRIHGVSAIPVKYIPPNTILVAKKEPKSIRYVRSIYQKWNQAKQKEDIQNERLFVSLLRSCGIC